MALPININELIHGSTVEWERIEFNEGSKSGLGRNQVGLLYGSIVSSVKGSVNSSVNTNDSRGKIR
jgi:hypothetical protein